MLHWIETSPNTHVALNEHGYPERVSLNEGESGDAFKRAVRAAVRAAGRDTMAHDPTRWTREAGEAGETIVFVPSDLPKVAP